MLALSKEVRPVIVPTRMLLISFSKWKNSGVPSTIVLCLLHPQTLNASGGNPRNSSGESRLCMPCLDTLRMWTGYWTGSTIPIVKQGRSVGGSPPQTL
ncbi:hypothetical protein CBD41_03850 [bacterium TMED181]|nr:hypothetical protein [Planctomycetota bacterium]OUW45510.1 MAG: hypothetical protein CBD41_03850 [bacterium TMED181]